ncbi:MAG: MFS transporter [Yoonia sp.]|jgi:MFS family permease|nr:MFS transporter [Yoonia sp.]
MKRGLVALLTAYVLSQFYRAFLPVLAPVLLQDIGATPDDLARASGIWFLIFAAMQIPVGIAFDSIGPRITAAVLFVFGGAGGALVFGFAQTPMHVMVAMGLIGVGCSPVLMASYFILARTYSAAVFASLAGAMIGFGSIGNLAGSAPLAWSVQTFGWRESMFGLAVTSLLVGLMLWAFVRDPDRFGGSERGSVLTLLKMPMLWPIMIMMLVNYAPAAGLRGLWAGPYMADVFDADVRTIGRVTFVMGAAMIVGSFMFGPLERLFQSRKWVIFAGNASGVFALVALMVLPDQSVFFGTLMLAIIGISGSTFAVLIAHAKAFFPPHLTGRGVTLMNLFGIGGAGIMQFASGPIYAASKTNTPTDAYVVLFAVFAGMVALGLLFYLRAQDRID